MREHVEIWLLSNSVINFLCDVRQIFLPKDKCLPVFNKDAQFNPSDGLSRFHMSLCTHSRHSTNFLRMELGNNLRSLACPVTPRSRLSPH